MKLPFLRSLLVVALVSIAVPATALDSNKWRLQCSGGADSDGVITLRITPKDGTPTDVAVAIKDNTGENGVARAIRDAIKAMNPARVLARLSELRVMHPEMMLAHRNFEHLSDDDLRSALEDVESLIERGA